MKLFIALIVYDDFCTKIVIVTEDYSLAKIELESEISCMKFHGDKISISTIKEIEMSVCGKETD